MYIVRPVVAELFIVRPCVGLSVAVNHAVAVFTNCVQKTVGCLSCILLGQAQWPYYLPLSFLVDCLLLH